MDLSRDFDDPADDDDNVAFNTDDVGWMWFILEDQIDPCHVQTLQARAPDAGSDAAAWPHHR
eukprot:1509323-Amphidinium_carterae.2